MDGLNMCMVRMVPMKNIIHDELQIFKGTNGRLFSSPLCIQRRANLQPNQITYILNFSLLFYLLSLLKFLHSCMLSMQICSKKILVQQHLVFKNFPSAFCPNHVTL